MHDNQIGKAVLMFIIMDTTQTLNNFVLRKAPSKWCSPSRHLTCVMKPGSLWFDLVTVFPERATISV